MFEDAEQSDDESDDESSESEVPRLHLDESKGTALNEYKPKRLLAMSFPVEYPFGITSFKETRHLDIESLQDYVKHLAWLGYQIGENQYEAWLSFHFRCQ